MFNKLLFPPLKIDNLTFTVGIRNPDVFGF